jgi:outer membrane lipopolysaccharide assembly protein LptE/RlpB
VLASDNEEQVVKEEMHADIIYQILNRLRLIPESAAESKGIRDPL